MFSVFRPNTSKVSSFTTFSASTLSSLFPLRSGRALASAIALETFFASASFSLRTVRAWLLGSASMCSAVPISIRSSASRGVKAPFTVRVFTPRTSSTE